MEVKKRILICDDEEGIRESLRLILEDNYELTMAKSGKECMETLSENRDIKAVLLDIKMPKQNGLEVMKEIKKSHPDIKVVIVTGYASAEIAQEAFDLGADGYIPKPFNPKKILPEINKLLV